MAEERWFRRRLAGAPLAILMFCKAAPGVGLAGDLDARVQDDFWTRSHLLGDWGGLRTRLEDRGIDLSASLVEEPIWNASGGRRSVLEQAGQASIGANIDGEKVLGWEGATFGVTLVQRWGRSQADEAGIPTLQLTNEVFGRGNILRLVEMYYQQDLFNGVLQVKVGRLPVGGDFFFQSCEFENLTFCGGQPGNVVGDYIYNWPVSQWGGVVRLNTTKQTYLQVGAYDSNDEYLSTDRDVALVPTWPSDSQGVLVPIEFGWKPLVRGLPGDYKIGGWVTDRDAPDVVRPGRIHDSRDGLYISLQQQFTGVANKSGLTAFFNATFADDETSAFNQQIYGGVIHKGTFAFRPQDSVALAVGVNQFSSRYEDVSGRDSEVVIEGWYGLQLTGWMNVKFDVQYIADPGGYSDDIDEHDNALLFGLKTAVNF